MTEGLLSEQQPETSSRLGEVVESHSASFVAQSYQLYGAPPLGGFVKVASEGIFGVVTGVSTEPLDPSRPVLARGQDAQSEEDLYRDHPQLARLLTSRFEAVIVGHQSGGVDHQYLPPLPPRVHSFVVAASREEVGRFTARLDFLRLLVASGSPLADEVVGACLRGVAAVQTDPGPFLERAGKALAGELSGDLPRLNAILRRLSL